MRKIKNKFLSRILYLVIPLTSYLLPLTSYASFLPSENSRIKGFQFGIAAPVLSPLPFASINGFVGQNFKHTNNFWTRRLAWRADFALPHGISASGRIDGVDIYTRGSVMGISHSRTFNRRIDFDFNDDYVGGRVNFDGMDGRFLMENKHFGVMADFFPFADTWFFGGFRVSGGYFIGSAIIDARATNTNPFPNDDGFVASAGHVASETFYIASRLSAGSQIGARLNWRYSGPYVGTGFDLGIFRGLKLFTDFGVVFANAPRLHNSDIRIPASDFQARIFVNTRDGVGSDWINIDISNPNLTKDNLIAAWIASGGIAGDIADLDFMAINTEYQRLRQSIVRDANHDMRNLRFVPMVRIGLMYRF
ncbi:MAG: hypothetical protein FWC83_00860 [Alphaproteobacteria bacterium]|nr:hypothetical protein [Alphaproteobacteria bacterium]